MLTKKECKTLKGLIHAYMEDKNQELTKQFGVYNICRNDLLNYCGLTEKEVLRLTDNDMSDIAHCLDVAFSWQMLKDILEEEDL